MRSKGALIQFIVALVLVLAQVPSSALAGIFSKHADCKMPCCLPQAAPQDSASICHSEAAPDPGLCQPHGAKASRSISERESPCKCSLSAPPEDRSSPVALAPASSQSSFQVDVAALPPDAFTIALAACEESQPGILGSDSGPPAQGPHCVWLGRAPPVFLA
jgi:hypothetical protein